MSRLEEFKNLIQNDKRTMRILHTVKDLNLPDWFVAAGAIRNTIWDIKEGFKEHTPLNDVDVVYFDLSDPKGDREGEYEKKLTEKEPALKWSVTNQVGMAEYHGDPPYKDTCDAISHWVESSTCVGAKLEADNSITICEPFGVDDVLDRIARINRKYPRSEDYARRKLKAWDKIWPGVKYLD